MTRTQKDKLLNYMDENKLARSHELRGIGVSATAISRAVKNGDIIRIARGLYQSPDAQMDIHASLAEVSKRAPKAVICLISALAYHGLTDQLARKVWIAIGAKDWQPKITAPPTRIVRFREPYFSEGIEIHDIGGVPVKIYSITKSLADAFRNPKLVDRSVAIECLRSALALHKATPGELAEAAQTFGAGKKIRPYLEALTANG